MTSWTDYYKALWREVSLGGGPLTGRLRGSSVAERLLEAVARFAGDAARELGEPGWDCEALEALARELLILAKTLRSDVLLEASLYGLERRSVEEALEALRRLEDASRRAPVDCRAQHSTRSSRAPRQGPLLPDSTSQPRASSRSDSSKADRLTADTKAYPHASSHG